MADDVTIKFGADIADLKTKIDEVLGSFGKFTSAFAAMAGIVAGGAAFKKFIDETIELNGEALKLSKMLGITGEEAGTLNTALGDIGANAETYAGAFLHFNRALRQNSDEMKSMGVDIDGLTSGQKTSNEVFVSALAVFAKYKPGIDQTQAAMKMFGRSVEDVYKIQRLANDVTTETAKRLGKTREELNATLTSQQKYNANMETAAEKNKALNLTITQEGLNATREYKEAMNEVGDVLKGVSKTIGEAVMPHFTAMAEQLASIGPVLVEGMGAAIQIMLTLWDEFGAMVSSVWGAVKGVLTQIGSMFGLVFGQDAPAAMDILKNAFRIIQIAIIAFSTGFQEMVAFTSTGVQLLVSWFKTFAAVAVAAMSFDFAGAKAAWQSGVDERVKIVADGTKKMIDIAVEGAAKMDAAVLGGLGIPKGTAAGAPKGGTDTMKIGKPGSDDPRLAANLARLKAQTEAELALEREYLKEAQSIYDEAFKNNLMSVEQYYAAKLAIEVKGLDYSLEAKRKERRDAAKAESDAQKLTGSGKPADRNKAEAEVIKFKTVQVQLTGQINVLEAQRLDTVRRIGAEEQTAARALNDTLSTIRATRAQSNANAEIAAQKTALAQMKALRMIDADQQFAAERAMEQKSFSAQMAFLANKRSLIHGNDLAALAQQDADEEAAAQTHQDRLTQIENAAVLERKKYALQAQQAFQDGFATMLSSFAIGQKSMIDSLKNFANQVATIFTNLIAQNFAERLFGKGTSGGNAIGGIANAIFGGLQSYDVGTSFVPQDMIAMVHKGERIVTARDNAAGGGGGRSMVVNNNFAIQGPVDTRTTQQIGAAAARGLSIAARRNG
jgi:hypothetical protein